MTGFDHVEAVLEATIQKVDAKTLYLKEREKLIQDAEIHIHDLQSASFSDEVGLVLLEECIVHFDGYKFKYFKLKKALESFSNR